MEGFELVPARSIVTGNIIFWRNEEWEVLRNYCDHPQLCYAKMSLTKEKHGKRSSMYTSKSIGTSGNVYRKLEKVMAGEHLIHAVDELSVLEGKLKDLATVLELPNMVVLGNSNIAVDRSVVEGVARKDVMASVNKLLNHCKKA